MGNKKFELLKKHFGTKNNGQLFIDLSGIDFGDYSILLSGSKTKGALYAASVIAENIYNYEQKADEIIWNDSQEAKNINNDEQKGIKIYNKNQKAKKIIH